LSGGEEWTFGTLSDVTAQQLSLMRFTAMLSLALNFPHCLSVVGTAA